MSDLFDFKAVDIADTEDKPQHKGGKQRKYETNPLEEFVKDANARGIGKEMSLPPRAISDAMLLLRQAGDDIKKGIRIDLYAKGKKIKQTEVKDLAPNVKVTLKFWVIEKRTYNRNRTETPATPTE